MAKSDEIDGKVANKAKLGFKLLASVTAFEIREEGWVGAVHTHATKEISIKVSTRRRIAENSGHRSSTYNLPIHEI